MAKVYHLFSISQGINGRTRVPIDVFIADNYEMAILYFDTYVEDLIFKTSCALYKIGEIQKGNTLKPCKIFITDGFHCNFQKDNFKKNNIKQEKLRIDKCLGENNQAEIIKKLFDGRYI